MEASICADAERIGSKLEVTEALGTCRAFGDRVVPAIDIAENMLFRAQAAGSLAIDMRQGIAVPFQGIGW